MLKFRQYAKRFFYYIVKTVQISLR